MIEPLVDVLIPAYNAAATVESAVDSIQRQTLTDLLIHVVDDGSTDDTPAILARLAAEDPRVRVHTRPNGGIVEALNFGLGFCRAEFLARHDADDLAYPERLRIQVDYLRAHPEVAAVGAAARHVDGDGRPTGTVALPEPPGKADAFAIPSREPYVIHPLLTARRAAMVAAGGYRYAFHAEDTDLYWRLAEQGALVNLPDVLADYRMHEASISSGSPLNGRIMALGSQLAGLSARRRRAGRPDLRFDRARLKQYEAAGSLERILALAGEELDEAERAYVTRAVPAKLIELASYRPYELEAEDCRFIGAVARRGDADGSAEARDMRARHLSGTAARLAAGGRWADALRLLSPRLLPGFLARVALRTAVPRPLRRFLQRRSTRAAPSK